jgi:hypothetical protein
MFLIPFYFLVCLQLLVVCMVLYSAGLHFGRPELHSWQAQKICLFARSPYLLWGPPSLQWTRYQWLLLRQSFRRNVQLATYLRSRCNWNNGKKSHGSTHSTSRDITCSLPANCTIVSPFCSHKFGGDDIYFGLVYVSHSGLNVYVTPAAVCKKGMNQPLHFPLSMERLYMTCNDVKNSRNVRSRGTSLNKSCALSSLCWNPARQSYVWGEGIMSRKLLYHSAALVPKEKPIKVKFSLSTPRRHVALEVE